MKKKNEGASAPKKKSKAKWLWIGLGAAALTGVLSYFGLELFDKKEETAPANDNGAEVSYRKKTDTSKIQAKQKPATAKPKAKKTAAPKTKQTGKTAKPKTETKTEAKTEPKLEKEQPAPIDANAVAKELYTALSKKDFLKSVMVLGKIKNVKDYTAVSKVFSTMFLRGVRQTVVNGTLGTFSLENQKKAIRLLFLKMGLKYNGSKWTLSGIDDRMLITTQQTKIWKDPRHAVVVPVNMVLGKELARRGEFSVFESDKRFFLVENKHVKYYQ